MCSRSYVTLHFRTKELVKFNHLRIKHKDKTNAKDRKR